MMRLMRTPPRTMKTGNAAPPTFETVGEFGCRTTA
jgi:hypothetical protein